MKIALQRYGKVVASNVSVDFLFWMKMSVLLFKRITCMDYIFLKEKSEAFTGHQWGTEQMFGSWYWQSPKILLGIEGMAFEQNKSPETFYSERKLEIIFKGTKECIFTGDSCMCFHCNLAGFFPSSRSFLKSAEVEYWLALINSLNLWRESFIFGLSQSTVSILCTHLETH